MITEMIGIAARRAETWLGLVLVVADQVTKALIVRNIPLHDTVPVIPNLLNLTHVLNTGAAFGLFNAADFPMKTLAIGLLAIGALIAIAIYSLSFGANTTLGRYSLTLILSGAIGNLIDRATTGAVVDFVDVYWGGWHFWAFNVADAAISVGATLLILDMLRAGRHVPNPV